jgi:hypothetical protein
MNSSVLLGGIAAVEEENFVAGRGFAALCIARKFHERLGLSDFRARDSICPTPYGILPFTMNCGTLSFLRSRTIQHNTQSRPRRILRSPAICMRALSAYLPRPTPMSLRFPGPLLNSELCTSGCCACPICSCRLDSPF